MALYLANQFWKHGGEIATTLICLWALWRGGLPERIGSLTMLIGWALTDLLLAPDGGPGPWVLAVDTGMFVSYAALAVWFRLPWSFFAAGCMLNAVATHYLHKITSFGVFTFATSETFWGGWAIIICLAWGVVSHRSRLRKRVRTLAAEGVEARGP